MEKKNFKWRVSFDFDSTLDRPDVQRFAKKLVNLGFEVWVCTSRADDETAFKKWHRRDHNEDLWTIVDIVGIPRERVFFSHCKDKHNFFLDNPGFIWHLDDDVIENSLLREFGNIVAISPDEPDWFEKCQSFLIPKIIFLDFDGVLNVSRPDYDRFGQMFHQRFINNLERIIEETGAKIVVTSSWRTSGLVEMRQMWQERNYPGEIVDITPRHTISKFFFDEDSLLNTGELFETPQPRGLEIAYWLKNAANFSRVDWRKDLQLKCIEESLVKNYVIIDDDEDILYTQREHFIKTSCLSDKDAIETYGLTNRLTEKAIKILNSSLIDLYYENNL